MHHHWRNGYKQLQLRYIMPKRITFSHSKQTIPHFMDKLRLVWASSSRIWRCQLQLWRESGKGHHRTEKRQVWCVPVSQLPPLYHQDDWVGLKCVVMVVRLRNYGTKLPVRFNFIWQVWKVMLVNWGRLSVSIGEWEWSALDSRCNF